MYISKFMTMAQIIREHPELVKVLKEQGLECADCLSRIVDTLEMAAEKHGVDPVSLLTELRSACQKNHCQTEE